MLFHTSIPSKFTAATEDDLEFPGEVEGADLVLVNPVGSLDAENLAESVLLYLFKIAFLPFQR